MLCRNPYLNAQGQLFPCGQCMPCRVNRRREWTHRIMLEANLKQDNTFVTLTYSDEHLPLVSSTPTSTAQPSTSKSEFLPTLDPKHLQDWLKRFRKEVSPLKVRYYAIGEYGDETQRPHYHLALFGYPNCLYGNSRYSRSRSSCCVHCDVVRSTWGKGNVFLGDITTNSAQYIAGYVTKKLTSKDDPRLLGRHPEFGRMSLKPGIGSDFMHDVASSLLSLHGFESEADVPSSLQHGTRKLPLGRYLRSRLRELTGREKAAPQATIDALQEELRPLREAAFDASQSFKKTVVEASDQKVLNAETKAKIFKQARKL